MAEFNNTASVCALVQLKVGHMLVVAVSAKLLLSHFSACTQYCSIQYDNANGTASDYKANAGYLKHMKVCALAID
jgi:hypothetical protein